MIAAPGPAEALAALGRFRVLCALREGPWGAAAFNALAERVLARAGLLPRGLSAYRGRPVMVTRNDYGLGLFNGDVGVLWPDATGGGALRAFFPVTGGGLRAVPPGRLPSHETVYAMTVHKSQGSEFDQVLLVVPDRPSPVLTDEAERWYLEHLMHSPDAIEGLKAFVEKRPPRWGAGSPGR